MIGGRNYNERNEVESAENNELVNLKEYEIDVSMYKNYMTTMRENETS